MAGGLAGLLDDIAALAKVAAASIDDVSAAAARASAKAAGVVVDDTAVTPAYVRGLAAERELPIIKRIAIGSLRNKLLLILPLALILSAFAPTLVEVILMLGGTYLCFEGAEKIYHRLTHDATHAIPAVMKGPEAEAEIVKGAVRTDLILSAEIMVISLKEVIDEPIVQRAIILVVVAVIITVIVYGVVALIVKMDDIGLKLAGHNQNGEKEWSIMATIVELVPGERFFFDCSSRDFVFAKWGYAIEPTDTGCRVTEYAQDLRPEASMARSESISGVADRLTHNRAGMEATLERLAAALESSAASQFQLGSDPN